jgi:hypothetical protein
VIVPDDEITSDKTFIKIIFGSNIQGHFLIDSWYNLVLDVWVWKGEFNLRFNLNIMTGLGLEPALLLEGNPGSVALFFGDIFLFQKSIPVYFCNEISPNV